ncbi:MAG: transaldolase [Acidobacteria bacterium RIFCSPLOWO2_12_FULL_60_22]|nr:MAG: transaldolase [Acidobacteria bacterium RIFCSPLOWO2_12_FULL_60_22]
MNPLKRLEEFGQSIWLDYIRRTLITSGELRQLIEQDGVKGVTSNPAIFAKAIAGSSDYTEDFKLLERQGGTTPKEIYERLAIRDIQEAAAVLRPVYEQTAKRDGYVSLEVSPYLAHNTQGTLEEARRLWKAVGRDNVMIKVPATPEGIPAIEQLIGDGINVNVTLLFSLENYERVAEAYIRGLEELLAKGEVSKVASVASIFVSRIDSAVDSIVSARLRATTNAADRARLNGLAGKVAIANCKLAYHRYKQIISSDRWRALADRGARPQRLLWASTGTKNPNYRDVLYVEELIGPDTVNTVPPATMDAFRSHGRPRASLVENLDEAKETLDILGKVGISLSAVTDQLLQEGVRLFAEAFDRLLNAVDQKCKGKAVELSQRQMHRLGGDLSAAVQKSLQDWQVDRKVRRLWARDASLWSGKDEGNWLGWLGIAEDQSARGKQLQEIAEEVKNSGFRDAVLLGMGGSSLCPEVLSMAFGKINGFPKLHVLDSTDPAQIRSLESKLDLARTLFIVSSKSGSTLEPNIFKQYFFERMKQVVGEKKAGEHFIAITDPSSQLQHVAEADGFRRILFGLPSVGGRYSALSDFGMVPAAISGVDVKKFLDQAEIMVHACAACVSPQDNPGVVLGTILGVLAGRGRDKLTLIASPAIYDLGAWLEQLIAESTGKNGKGIIPVDRELLGAPAVYGADRVFVYIRLESSTDPAQEKGIDALEKAGHPVVRISVADRYNLGQEFFRWEIATAVAGAILGINAFDQPDVEASKLATRQLTAEVEKTGSLPKETPILEEGGVKVFAEDGNATALGRNRSLAGILREHLNRLQGGDYFALLAYIEMNEPHHRQLQANRHAIRDRRRVATCLGFGPRFLHSTGQAYKGGPNTGVFLQITCDDATDLAVQGQKYTFGAVKAAQARGDFQVLAERGRRALRVHLGANIQAGLDTLQAAIKNALA